MIKITAISDLHGETPVLSGGDLLIVAGDMTANDRPISWGRFFIWLRNQPYDEKVIIGGNHDNFLQDCIPTQESKDLGLYDEMDDFHYLMDNGCELLGLKIWGSPWTKTFEGMNPECMAFTKETEEELKEPFNKIPANLDILITHSPPFTIMDKAPNANRVGSEALYQEVCDKKPKIHLFGHIHGSYGKLEYDSTTFYNCSHMNDDYEPVNPAWNFTYEPKS